jgi:hypothetical protein
MYVVDIFVLGLGMLYSSGSPDKTDMEMAVWQLFVELVQRCKQLLVHSFDGTVSYCHYP